MASVAEEAGAGRPAGARKERSERGNGRWRSMPSILFSRKSEPELDVAESGEANALELGQRQPGVVVYNGVAVNQHEGYDIEHVGCLSSLFMSWITSLIRVGYRQTQLETDDLWRLRSVDDPDPLAEQLAKQFETLRSEDGKRLRSDAIFRAAFRMFYWDLVCSGLLELGFSALRFAGPILLRELVLALQDGTANGPRGYLLGFGLFLAQALSTICQSHSRFISVSIGLRLKNALSLTTFKHVLRLDQEGKQQLSNGKVVNLLSTDAQVAVEFMRLWNRFWTAPIVLLAGVAYIYVYVGVSVFFGVLLMASFVPLSISFGKVQTKFQRRKMAQTDVRVKLVNEMMLGIKVLKLNAWERPLLAVLNKVRDVEMVAIRRLHFYRGITMPFAIAIPNIASVVTFAAFILLGNQVTPADTFAVVSAFVIIRAPFVTLPLAISMISRALVSSRRFADFFSLGTVDHDSTLEDGSEGREDAAMGQMPSALSMRFDQDGPKDHAASDDNTPGGPLLSPLKPPAAADGGQEFAIVAEAAFFSWSFSQPEAGDAKVALTAPAPGGAGAGGVPASAQAVTPGDGPAPFRLQNISFRIPRGELVGVIGRIGDGKSSLISAALGEMRTESGDLTVKGRLALCTQEPFIMNRTVRENILFELPFDEKRYNQTLEACALVSDLAILPASDLTEIGERGVNVSGGQKARIALARAVYAQPDVVLLDDPLSAVDAHVGKHIFNHCISNNEGSVLRGSTRIFVTNQLHLLEQMDRILLMKDGCIVEQGTFAEIMARETSLIKELQQQHALAGDDEVSLEESAAEEEGDRLTELPPAPKGTSRQRTKGLASDLGVSSIRLEDDSVETKAKRKGMLIDAEGREEGQIGLRVISSYWLAGSRGSYVLAFMVLASFLVTEGVFLSIDSWLAFYSQEEPGTTSEKAFLGIYVGLTVAFFVVLMARALVYAAFSVRACRVLYYRLQNNVFYLPMEFFWQTPLGRVLNRLSKDTNDCDVMLPEQMQWLIMTLVRVIGVLCIISFTVPVFLVAIVPFFLIYFGIREYYRRTSVSAQRIESVLRSPVYSHLGETLQGVSTIKAFKRSGPWLRVASSLIGLNHRAHFAVETIQIWLSMRLEFLGALIVFVTAICIVATDADPGLAGLALAYSLNVIINLNMSVQMATQVESKMNAVERMIEYSELESERTLSGSAAPEGWPARGDLSLEGVTLSYRANLEPAIKGVSIEVPAGTKVAIVGATGSGKSTLMVALFRLAPLSAGRITLDGVDIGTVDLHDVRAAITCIPQDPVLFTSSLRKNLDPFDAYDDAAIWDAIEKTHLRKTVEALPNGIESVISEGGSNLSLGERQLVCIARAVLRQSRIIMLDEATASIDRETDALIQNSIRTSFQGCTILVIAHRLETVLDLDLALVMDGGRVAEFDRIPRLLENKEGKLSKLVEAANSAH